MSGKRPSTPSNATEANNFEAGEKVYYALASDTEWKMGKIIEKRSSEGSDKYKVKDDKDGHLEHCQLEDLRKLTK